MTRTLTFRNQSLSGGCYASVATAGGYDFVLTDAEEPDQLPRDGEPCYLAVYRHDPDVIAATAPVCDSYHSDPWTARHDARRWLDEVAQ